MESVVQNRLRAIKSLIDAFSKDVRGRLCIEYFPVSSSEFAEIEHGLNYKLPKEKREEFGEEMAAKLEQVFGELRDFKIKQRVDLPRLMQLMEIARRLEKDSYSVGLEDIDPHRPPELTELDRHALCLPEGKTLTEGSLLVIYIEPEA